jgi:glycosyltransferase involved in cell wall biosynthesis
MSTARITVVVPSFNQGAYLDQALRSIFEQNIAVEVFVEDGGSTDNSLSVLDRWAPRLAGWRSSPDGGQAEAINVGMAFGTAPYVCWLNSDDMLLPGGLEVLAAALDNEQGAPAAYGRTWDHNEHYGSRRETRVERFSQKRLAMRCIISQPGTLIRRSVWDTLGGLDRSLHMAPDYDLWWRIYRQFGEPAFVDRLVAVRRIHDDTKSVRNRARHYDEAMATVRKHHGRLPLQWWLARPLQVWVRSGFTEL